MEAARTSDTLVNFYQTTRRYNPEDNHLRTHNCEILKSYCVLLHFIVQVFAQNLYAMKMSDSAGLTNGGDNKFR
jgi:hypothetical protein